MKKKYKIALNLNGDTFVYPAQDFLYGDDIVDTFMFLKHIYINGFEDIPPNLLSAQYEISEDFLSNYMLALMESAQNPVPDLKILDSNNKVVRHFGDYLKGEVFNGKEDLYNIADGRVMLNRYINHRELTVFLEDLEKNHIPKISNIETYKDYVNNRDKYDFDDITYCCYLFILMAFYQHRYGDDHVEFYKWKREKDYIIEDLKSVDDAVSIISEFTEILG